jgi:hypothetical protein
VVSLGVDIVVRGEARIVNVYHGAQGVNPLLILIACFLRSDGQGLEVNGYELAHS